jgi:hypothetical protein
MSVQVRPATADRWSDLVRVFGRRGEDPSWCWCQTFLRPAADTAPAREPAPDNRAGRSPGPRDRPVSSPMPAITLLDGLGSGLVPAFPG